MIFRQTLTLICLVLTSFSFSLNSKGLQNIDSYNVQQSKVYAGYASLAFCPKQCLQSWTCQTGFDYPNLTHVKYINNIITLSAGYIGYQPSNKTIIISFRGSSNARNFFEDDNAELEPFLWCKGCYIHTGFHVDYFSNAKKVRQGIKQIRELQEVQKIMVTGHSLGASLATIYGLHLSIQIKDIPVKVHNFGSPRVGNDKLSKFINQMIPDHFRVVHSHDIAPHLPNIKSYHHASTEIFFDSEMKQYKLCNASGQDQQCSNKYAPDYTWQNHRFYFINIETPDC